MRDFPCLCSAAAWAVCFEGIVAVVNATETGNEVSQPTLEFTPLNQNKSQAIFQAKICSIELGPWRIQHPRRLHRQDAGPGVRRGYLVHLHALRDLELLSVGSEIVRFEFAAKITVKKIQIPYEILTLAELVRTNSECVYCNDFIFFKNI